MQRILLALVVTAAAAAPALAQSRGRHDLRRLRQAGQDPADGHGRGGSGLHRQKQAGQQLMSDEIFTQLTTKCSGHDDMMLMDAMK